MKVNHELWHMIHKLFFRISGVYSIVLTGAISLIGIYTTNHPYMNSIYVHIINFHQFTNINFIGKWVPSVFYVFFLLSFLLFSIIFEHNELIYIRNKYIFRHGVSKVIKPVVVVWNRDPLDE